jgi:prolyl-tRNA synthetase
MLQSELFAKTKKEFPKDEESASARLLMKAGFVEKLSSGIFTYLPLGFRVVQKIADIVREEMNAIGAEELLMPALVAKEYWLKTNRWDVDVVYKLKDASGSEFGLGWTHEEVVSTLAKGAIQSYQDLPKAVYQIQTKFRSEARAKSGVLRGREFMMKDLYSFHADEEDLRKYYDKVSGAYLKAFKRMGLKPIVAEAAGGAFTNEYTHEFQVATPAGEDVVFFCGECGFAQNKEIAKVLAGDKCAVCGKGVIQETKAIEVGNIFKLGDRYSKDFDVYFTDKLGAKKHAIMGCYGIGITRLMGTIAEVYHDDRGMMWPESVAPFKAHLLALDVDDTRIAAQAKKIYSELKKKGVEVLYDNRQKSAGEKFGDADLMGIPYRLVVSRKTKGKVEVKKRNAGGIKFMTSAQVIKMLSK